MFFKTTWTDQNSSTKVLQNIIVVFFSFFRHSVFFPFQFFSALSFFLEKKFYPKGGTPSFFLLFCDGMDVGNPQRVLPFSFFRHCETFFPKKFIKGSPTHQYFDILKSFCYFWALDMAPTWAVPGLLFVSLVSDWPFSVQAWTKFCTPAFAFNFCTLL